MDILKSLTDNSKNEIVIISGRDKDTLERWFSGLKVNLVAEHSAWIKEKGDTWKTSGTFSMDWKKKVLPILEKFVDTTPGSFIEEKEFSLAWHYRKSDYELGMVRVQELREELSHIRDEGMDILEGKKVLEVRCTGINKGKAILKWIKMKNWGFIMALGDDRTDEDMFDVLPQDAYSIKVGWTPSKAKFYLDSHLEVRDLLEKMGEKYETS